MAQTETHITISPARGLFFLVGAAGLSILGYGMLFHGDELVLKVVGFAFLFAFPVWLIMIITTGFGGEGPCPVCNSRIQTYFGNESDIPCKTCGRYLDAKNKMLREIDPHCLAGKPTFAAPTPWTDIDAARSKTISLSKEDYISDAILIRKEGVRVLDAHWPEGCCVCGKKATREQTVVNTFVYTPPGVIRIQDKEVTVVVKGVPHCAEHQDGVAFGNTNFGNPPRRYGFSLLFRSYDYRNKFMKLNPWKWT
jgi:hypothetical protein